MASYLQLSDEERLNLLDPVNGYTAPDDLDEIFQELDTQLSNTREYRESKEKLEESVRDLVVAWHTEGSTMNTSSLEQ